MYNSGILISPNLSLVYSFIASIHMPVPTFCSCILIISLHAVILFLYIFSIVAMVRKLLACQKHTWADSLGQLTSSHWGKCALSCSVFYLLFFWITRVVCWDTCSGSTHSQLPRRWLCNPGPAQSTAIQPCSAKLKSLMKLNSDFHCFILLLFPVLKFLSEKFRKEGWLGHSWIWRFLGFLAR